MLIDLAPPPLTRQVHVWSILAQILSTPRPCSPYGHDRTCMQPYCTSCTCTCLSFRSISKPKSFTQNSFLEYITLCVIVDTVWEFIHSYSGVGLHAFPTYKLEEQNPPESKTLIFKIHINIQDPSYANQYLSVIYFFIYLFYYSDMYMYI